MTDQTRSGAQTPGPLILVLNGGSSSIKFSVFELGPAARGRALRRRLHGTLDAVGQAMPRLRFSDVHGDRHEEECPAAVDPPAAATALLDWLGAQMKFDMLTAVGHRIVHGMQRSVPEVVTPALVDALRRLEWADPDHLPGEIALIEAVRARAPSLSQVACFDTAFHREMPRVARLMAVPARLQAQGVQRYGFHGLSYAYLVEELERVAGRAAAHGRVILAHLGNGASMAAVHGAQSLDTSMGFTPASGLPMGTRSGDIDPGLALFLERSEGMTPRRFDQMVNHESGLMGVSQTSSDMRELLAAEASDPRAADAVALFCYEAKKCIGAYAAALGGLDSLVFAGGIGEHAPPVRERICAGLGFLGIALDAARNAADAGVISSEISRVTVRVIRTDEELMIARSVALVLGHAPPPEAAGWPNGRPKG